MTRINVIHPTRLTDQHLLAENERLRAILACERGEKAPEGWAFDRRSEAWFRCSYRVERDEPGSWTVYRWSGQREDTLFDAVDTALEAIEAADNAAKVPNG